MMHSPWLGILLVLAVLGLVMAGLKHLGVRLELHPETSRKGVHVVMGLITLSFPWLFHETWPVFLLAFLAVTGLAGLRLVAPLRARFGKVLGGVERQSWGELYFPLAVALLFHLYRGNLVMYVIPLLTLTLADAVAALVGLRYGQHKFRTSEGYKSTEGSLAFFTVAFLSVHVPLLLLTDTGRAESLLIALLIGVLVMLFEAISIEGVDNLFIPLGTYSLLRRYLTFDAEDLFWRLGALSAVAVLVYIWRTRTTLRESALLAAALVGYMNWTLGGWQWLAVSLVLFVTYPRIWPPSAVMGIPVHTMQVVASVAAPGMVWLMAGIEMKTFDAYIPFVMTYAVQSVFVGMIELEKAKPMDPVRRRLLHATFLTWLFFAPLFLLPLQGAVPHITRSVLWVAVTSLPLLMLAGVLYHAFKGEEEVEDRDGYSHWLKRSLIAMVVSGGGLVGIRLL